MILLTTTTFLFILLFTKLSISNKAPKIKKNPQNIVAIADFPFGGNREIQGNIVFTTRGKYVNVHVDMTGFPKDSGPFYYHIHERSVPENGNCEACGLHFNPYHADTNCLDQKHDGYCQIGDLSGKHGLINSTCFEFKFTDPYLSLNKRSKSYIVGKSIVFHYPNMTKIACADIELANDLRFQSLVDEYTQTDDTQQLIELQQSLKPDFTFDGLEALKNEVYESDDDDNKQSDGKEIEHGSVIDPILEPIDEDQQDDETISRKENIKQILKDAKILPQKLVNKTKNHWSKDDEDQFKSGHKYLDNQKKKIEKFLNFKSDSNNRAYYPKNNNSIINENLLNGGGNNLTNITLHGIASDCANLGVVGVKGIFMNLLFGMLPILAF
ncbi:uncharacterized protein KGF55_004503 [Candida pseudojiufengensis]|uniref:uncharacterized protein n=1 Tax=Candida pseudojiufengensis TaxID=497109 RepID=UPI002224F02F|nr:uncharacterized protein KGF55_004503 [Candida pseudojiufengensis]KAI5960610.1 hypothetical protein KGF55_004503 [Candida pseudojiufengensis]